MVNMIKKYFFVCIAISCLVSLGNLHAMGQNDTISSLADKLEESTEWTISYMKQHRLGSYLDDNSEGGEQRDAAKKQVSYQEQVQLSQLLLLNIQVRRSHSSLRTAFMKQIQELIALGAFVNYRSEEEDTPLKAAIVRGQPECVVDVLLAAGARIDSQDKGLNSKHLLWWASFHGITSAFKILVEAGFDVNKAVFVDTPLFVAHDAKAIRELVDLGALLDMQNRDGETALFRLVALSNSVEKMSDSGVSREELENKIKMLIWLGARHDIPNKAGETAWGIADVSMQPMIRCIEKNKGIAEIEYVCIACASEVHVGVLWNSMPSVVREVTGEYVTGLLAKDFRNRYSNAHQMGDSAGKLMIGRLHGRLSGTQEIRAALTQEDRHDVGEMGELVSGDRWCSCGIGDTGSGCCVMC